MGEVTITQAVAEVVAAQPWFVRRKDTLVAVIGTLAQLLQLLLVFSQDWPQWVALLIGAIIGLCQALSHATTKGAVTPSMAPRLTEAAGRVAEHDTPPTATATATTTSGTDSELPVYNL